ncbi:MAG: hypothetical protein WC679_02670 [Bacteroidales bacterium]|jgi:hypothetical protein
MKFRELLEKLDKSKENQTDIDMYKLGQEFNVDLDYYCEDESKRLVGYYIQKWYCTDTWVGLIAMFLDDEFIGYSSQLGRKCDVEYHFSNKELFDKTRQYLLTFVEKKDFYYPEFDIDFDEELGDGYILDYDGQHLTRYVKYLPTGEFVDLLYWNNSYGNKDYVKDLATIEEKFPKTYTGSISKVKFPNGNVEFVEARTLEVPYPVIKD